MRRTASVISVSLTVCGIINKAQLQQQMQDNLEVKLKFEKQMDKYKDSYFKFLVTMVRNVFCFR